MDRLCVEEDKYPTEGQLVVSFKGRFPKGRITVGEIEIPVDVCQNCGSFLTGKDIRCPVCKTIKGGEAKSFPKTFNFHN